MKPHKTQAAGWAAIEFLLALLIFGLITAAAARALWTARSVLGKMNAQEQFQAESLQTLGAIGRDLRQAFIDPADPRTGFVGSKDNQSLFFFFSKAGSGENEDCIVSYRFEKEANSLYRCVRETRPLDSSFDSPGAARAVLWEGISDPSLSYTNGEKPFFSWGWDDVKQAPRNQLRALPKMVILSFRDSAGASLETHLPLMVPLLNSKFQS